MIDGRSVGRDGRGDDLLVGHVGGDVGEIGVAVFSPLLTHLCRNVIDVGGRVVGPAFIGFGVARARVGAVDSGEEHLDVGHRFVTRTFDFLDIPVGLAWTGLDNLGVGAGRVVIGPSFAVTQITIDHACSGEALLVDAHDIGAVDVLIRELLGEHGSVEQRSVAVLLTIEI